MEVTQAEGQLRPSLRDIVEDIARNEGFSDFSLDVSRASAKGDNYVGMVLRVKISGRREGKDNDGMSLVVKCVPEKVQRDLSDYFNNEMFMYSDVLAAFRRLQEERGILEEERFTSVARCYACDKTDGDTALVMEDMSARGYRMADRLTGLDATHCSLVMRELGRFHAFSFALRDQLPQEFLRLRSPLKETIFRPVNTAQNLEKSVFSKMVDHASSVMSKRFPQDSEYMKRFRAFGSVLSERMSEIVKGEEAEPYAIICHGDCWTNNMLFKYSQDNTPEAVCLLDLQLSRYSSPMTDISYFLYCCTEASVRREAYKSLLSDYYESFSQFLRKLGSDPDKLFPYSALEEHERKFSQFGLAMAVIAMPLFTARSEDTPDFGKITEDVMKNTFEKSAVNDTYLRRMSDVVEDMVDRNFI